MKPISIPILLAGMLATTGLTADAPQPEPAKPIQAATNSVGMPLVPIAAGEFLMGSARPREESPQHKVKIRHAYSIGATEVTRGHWKTVMGGEPPDMGLKDVTDNHPVVGVTWFEAVEFCRKLSAKEGKTYRLPTEAEWEYACRAGTTAGSAFGKSPTPKEAHCETYSPFSKPKGMDRVPDAANKSTKPAGSLNPNGWGLYDMHGNAQEWCCDWFDGEYYLEDALARHVASLPEAERARQSYDTLAKVRDEMKGIWPAAAPTDGERSRRLDADRLPAALKLVADDPLGPERGSAGKRVVRGGCWRSGPPDCTSAARKGADPLWRNNTIGFRVVCEADAGLSKRMKFSAAPGDVDVPGFGKLPLAVVNVVGMRLNLVKPGKVLMGTYDKIEIGFPPYAIRGHRGVARHEEEVKEPFYLAVTHHTRAERALCDQPAPYELERPSTAPWYDGMDAALRLSERDGRRYRFPTVVEFECAQRAGTTTTWYWGDDWEQLPKYEWSAGWGPGERDIVRHVGRLLPNPWGFYDMCGNSHNWTSTPLPGAGTDPPAYCMPGAAYRYGNVGIGHNGSKFGNYRNCTRHGGYRFALSWRDAQPVKVDDKFRREILEKRYGNYMEGGRYGLTRPADGGPRTRPRNGEEGLTNYAKITADSQADSAKACFLKALALKPDDPMAKAGLEAAEKLAREYLAAKAKGAARKAAP